MKRLREYNPTSEEMRMMYSNGEDYKEMLEALDESPGSNYERYHIAHLLFIRGQREESIKMLESIEDEKYRRACLNDYFPMWDAWDGNEECL